jgi:hypothetical protein
MKPAGAVGGLGLALGAMLMVAACSSHDHQTGQDAGLDAPQVDAAPDAAPGCQPEFGRSFIIDMLELLPQGEGADLDGDGTPDNELGVLAVLANPGWVDSIANGYSIYVFDVERWTDPPTPTSADVQLAFFQPLDHDNPPDPSNNVSGTGEFDVPADQFDVACQPTSRWDHTTLQDYVLEAQTARWSWVSPRIGTIELSDCALRATISQDFTRLEGQLTGVYTVCGLSKTRFPGTTSGSLLDVLANQYGPPDIDRDGDGIEQIIGDGTSIKECIDGDGTVISGHDCPCDPRIQDGYSTAFRSTGITARLTGVVASSQ